MFKLTKKLITDGQSDPTYTKALLLKNIFRLLYNIQTTSGITMQSLKSLGQI